MDFNHCLSRLTDQCTRSGQWMFEILGVSVHTKARKEDEKGLKGKGESSLFNHFWARYASKSGTLKKKMQKLILDAHNGTGFCPPKFPL